jgi:hypothetical protein
MKFMCLAYGDVQKMNALSKSQMDELGQSCQPYMEDLRKTGRLHLDNGLSFDTAVIRPRKGKAAITDGPFVESKEQVGGVFIVEAANLQEAVAIAARHPAANLGEHLGWGIEVRPITFESPSGG